MQIDEARGIAAKVWLLQNHRRKVMDKELLESFANILLDEVEKANLPKEPTVAQSRQAIAKAFQADPSFRKSYEANIAETILADQLSDSPANLTHRGDCAVLADVLIKVVFES